MAKKRKKHTTAYRKAYKKIAEESLRQCYLIYGAAGIALYRHWNRKKTAIYRLFDLSRQIWNECAQDNNRSMIQMCEKETGIEIQNGDGKSWKELPYLNSEIDTGMYTSAQLVYIRQQQVRWIAAQVTACILIALHRKYRFGFDRCSRFYGQIMDAQAECNMDPQKVREMCLAETGINVSRIVTEENNGESSRED